jgi:RNA polymerase sigma-70 factor, ECF subfamily
MLVLIRKAKSGDRGSFDALYRMYAAPVYRFAFARTRNPDDAEDITQDVFLKMLEALGSYQERGSGMLPYLFTIARNLIINHGKKKRADVMPPDELDRHGAGEDPEMVAIQKEDKRDVLLLLEELNEGEREVIELKFFGERSYAEISDTLGKREDAIRQTVARAIKKMRLAMTHGEQRT